MHVMRPTHKENAAGAMSVARDGKGKSDARTIAASRYSFNSAATVINTKRDDGHAERTVRLRVH